MEEPCAVFPSKLWPYWPSQSCFRCCFTGRISRSTHPLDALKTQEYWAVYDVLRDSGKMQDDTVTHSVLLHEPAKDKVLAWKPGDPIFREAEVILLRKGVTIEALVDISRPQTRILERTQGRSGSRANQ